MATTRVVLPANTYTSVGTAPCTIQLENTSKPVYIIAAGSAPAANAVGIQINTLNGAVADIGSAYAGNTIYAKPIKTDNTAVIVMSP